jgi:NAD(P)-dependent dehydrogenase (short-subunit alcohol dehydrogenase family)
MIALVTGGASGLGESITRKIAADAKNAVYFTYCKSAENAGTMEKELSNAVAIRCDFHDGKEVDSLNEKIGGLNLDVLVNNAYAGSFIRNHFHKTDPGDYLAGFRENIVPIITLTQAAINAFRRKKSGKIITVLTSAIINTPPIGSSVYVANKAYLAELVKVWATENAKFNISSNAVSPSFMQTAFTGEIDERIVEQMRGDHPMKALLTPDEAAEAVLFLANASPQINGVNLVINAGKDIA